MALTLRFLLSEATHLAGVGPELAPSRVSEYVNLALSEIATRVPHRELEALAVSSTTSGENRFFLPADLDHVIALSFATEASGEGGRVIRQAAPGEFDAVSQGTSLGVPNLYLSYNTWLELYPSPDSSYSLQLRYKARISELTNPDSVPSLATRYQLGVLYKAAEFMAERSGDFKRAAYLGNRYISFMGSVPDVTEQRQRDRAGLGLRLQSKED